ncbi:MAG TPA: hypothetical protein VKB57_27570 [Acidimicrobiales bacterium]|nr:hypothetical protein [Acidimicrobiales bacterium]
MAVVRDPYRFKASDWKTAKQWRRWENVGLDPTLDLTDLVLNWTDRRVTDLEARGAITSIELERTIEGASTLTIVLRDPDARLFSTWAGRMRPRVRPLRERREPAEVDEGWEPLLGPELIGKAMQVTLDGAVFRLVGVQYNHADQEVTLTFEDRIVYLLRRKRGERRASRAKVTRAQFVLSLLREIKLIRPPFVCPQLTTRQAIDRPDTGSSSQRAAPRASTQALRMTASDGGTTAAAADTETTSGFAAGANLTVKGKPASAAQRGRMEGILSEAQRLGCSANVMAACLACATQESVMGEQVSQTGNDDVGIMQQGRNWIPASDVMDPRLVTNAFLLSGTPQAKGKGTAPGWLKKHGSLKAMPGGFEAAIKGVQVSVGGYGAWQAESERAVKAWGGAPSAESDAAAGGGEYVKSYQFAREPDEDSWTAIQRLAEEVGWRCFIVGEAVYFMSEEQLYRRRPRYEITARSDLLLDLRYDVDWGKSLSEATLTVALDRWGAPPGAVMLLSGFGPPDGRWLVTSVRRDWFEPTAEVTIKQPGKQKLEPASERTQRSTAAVGAGGTVDDGTAADSSATGRCYAEAKAISDRGLPYIWGGGHARCGTADAGTNTPSKNSGPPPGFDCSGYVCAILAAGRLGFTPGQPAMASGGLMTWGQPGKGERLTVYANPGHTFIEFTGMGSGKFADTGRNAAPPADRGPRLRSGTRSTDGFTVRHWPGA